MTARLSSSQGPRGAPALRLAASLGALAIAGALWQLWQGLAPRFWLSAAFAPSGSVDELLFHFSVLPRLAVAALVGAALAAAGTIFQHVLDNPLASPTILGVSAGAQLAIIAATLMAPTMLAALPDGPPLVGGLAAMALALTVAAPWRFTPSAVILAGIAVGLFCGALGHALKLLNGEYLGSVLLWSAGALDQDSWAAVAALLPRLAGLAVLTLVLLQPLALLGFGDESARGLGVPAGWIRVASLTLAVGYAAVVIAAVGTVGFVDIAAPLIARLVGARRLRSRLLVAPAIGAALLLVVDTLVQVVNMRLGTAVPTGAVTAVLAAPLILSLVPRLRADPRAGAAPSVGGQRRRTPALLLSSLLGLAVMTLALSCLVGITSANVGEAGALLPWRLPRAIDAFAAGAMLAAAGAILQRVTGNMLASPEILGLGAAVVAGFAVVLFAVPTPSGPMLAAAGAASAVLCATALFGGSWRAHVSPDQVLLRGVALTAAIDAFVTVCLALNDNRAPVLLGFLAGSTAGASLGGATVLIAFAAILIAACLLFVRPLDVLPLGEAAARGLGIAPGPARAGLMGLAALLTAVAVLAVGPLSFVGLVGPHLARQLGVAGAAAEIPAAALVGGLVMLLADWVGRVALGPFELPAGLVAALIGCPYLVIQLRRRG